MPSEPARPRLLRVDALGRPLPCTRRENRWPPCASSALSGNSPEQGDGGWPTRPVSHDPSAAAGWPPSPSSLRKIPVRKGVGTKPFVQWDEQTERNAGSLPTKLAVGFTHLRLASKGASILPRLRGRWPGRAGSEGVEWRYPDQKRPCRVALPLPSLLRSATFPVVGEGFLAPLLGMSR